MANTPGENNLVERIIKDNFLGDYTDRFLPTIMGGKGTAESPFTNMTGPEGPIPMTKEQTKLEQIKLQGTAQENRDKLIHPESFKQMMGIFRPDQAIPFQPRPETATGPFSNSPEGQAIMGERAVQIPHVSTGFRPPTGGGTLEEIFGSPYFARGGNVINKKAGPGGSFEAKPVPTGGWDWRGELANQGTWSVGPDRWFSGGKEIYPEMTPMGPALPPGTKSGDELARERIFRETGGSAIPMSALGGAPVQTGRVGETPAFEIPGDIKSALEGIQRILMAPSPSQDVWSPGGNIRFPGGYGKAQKDTLAHLAGTLVGYQTKMAEIGAEKPYREAMADYYRRKAGVEEAALPAEFFEKMARGRGYLAEAERPHAFPPNSAVYQGAELLGYVPEKPEAIHPIIRDVINKSMMVDPTTGQQTGFDIRGARQKIGFMVPWLKAQGITVPKESYKMTKPEFMAEQKAFMSRLPKKDRSKYTPQYTEQLWSEYWGKD